MFIIYGTKVRTENQGVVGDWCWECDQPHGFTVKDFFEVTHVYWLSFGSGTRVATIRKCWGCSTEYNCTPRHYRELVTVTVARNLTIRQLVWRTNPRLAEQVYTDRPRDIGPPPPDVCMACGSELKLSDTMCLNCGERF